MHCSTVGTIQGWAGLIHKIYYIKYVYKVILKDRDFKPVHRILVFTVHSASKSSEKILDRIVRGG